MEPIPETEEFIHKHSVVRVGVATVIEHEGKVLLGLRNGKHAPGTWACPGGHQEWGEDPRDTAIRETKEETDLDVVALDGTDWKLGWNSTVYENEGRHYITLFVRCSVLNPENLRNVEPHKCERWEWFDPQNLPDNMMTCYTAEVIKAIKLSSTTNNGLAELEDYQWVG